MRYSPAGTSGDYLYTTDINDNATELLEVQYPGGEVETGVPLMFEARWQTSSLTQATVA